MLPGLAAFVAVGSLGLYRYLDNYWVYRGFPPPRDPGFVTARGTAERFYVTSPALGGRSQPSTSTCRRATRTIHCSAIPSSTSCTASPGSRAPSCSR
jgi:hypothetical protein